MKKESISKKLINYVSQLSLPNVITLVAQKQEQFSKKEKDALVDLNWLYNQDSICVCFTQDESGNLYLYKEQSTIPKRLDKYSNYFEFFERLQINMDNLGEFMLFCLKKEGTNLTAFEEKITSLIEQQQLIPQTTKPKIL